MPPPCSRHCFAKAYSEERPEAQRFRNAGMQAARFAAFAGMAADRGVLSCQCHGGYK
jgi:hypothetical protein